MVFEPYLSAEMAYVDFQASLQIIQNRRNDPYEKALEDADQQWIGRTRDIVEATFGNPSQQLDDFNKALRPKRIQVQMYGTEPDFAYKQQKYNDRIRRLEPLLLSFLETLEKRIPSGFQNKI
jgi:hypothetical protein